MYEPFARLLEEQGIPPSTFSKFRPWLTAFLSGTLYSTDHGVEAQLGVDQFLQNWIFARGDLTLSYLETMEEQIDMFANLPPAQEQKLFELAVEQSSDLATVIEEVVEAWTTWDETELYRLSFGQRDARTLRRILLDDRNLTWAGRIDGLATQHDSIFVAVGSGHLVGDNNLIEVLTQLGWELQD